MNSNGWGTVGRARASTPRRAVSLGGLFTTLAANNEGKNRPGRYLDALPFKENVIGERVGLSLLLPATTSLEFAGIIETVPRTPLITVLRRS